MINVINKLYRNCNVNTTLGKESRDISYENGIQQGDNMAPILFLFIMQAVMEMLKQM